MQDASRESPASRFLYLLAGYSKTQAYIDVDLLDVFLGSRG